MSCVGTKIVNRKVCEVHIITCGACFPGKNLLCPIYIDVLCCVQVLQVHEQLERPHDAVGTNNLGDTEKAIVREMCNVCVM